MSSGPDARMMLAIDAAIGLAALCFEAGVGYPAALFAHIGHPVTWFGALIAWLDRSFNREASRFSRRRLCGFAALGVLLSVVVIASLLVQVLAVQLLPPIAAGALLGCLGSSCLAQRSLHQHVRAVADALRQGIPAGRAAVAMIVGRDTTTLDESGIARAAIESLAENFADGIVAPSLYLLLGGLPGGLVYKAINTADSMIGHRSPRHLAFGFAAAKLDDIVNWPAARLAGLWIVLAAALSPSASPRAAWRIMRRDARGHPSPNAGWPEAAMAGALGIRLGGARSYAGRVVEDAAMGDGDAADLPAIDRALALYRLACALNAVASLGVALLILGLLIGPWR